MWLGLLSWNPELVWTGSLRKNLSALIHDTEAPHHDAIEDLGSLRHGGTISRCSLEGVVLVGKFPVETEKQGVVGWGWGPCLRVICPKLQWDQGTKTTWCTPTKSFHQVLLCVCVHVSVDFGGGAGEGEGGEREREREYERDGLQDGQSNYERWREGR